MSRITHTQKRGKYTRNKKGGEQNKNKQIIKNILDITHEKPDSYDPKSRGLKFYYNALLDIYNIIWKNLNLNDKKKLIKEITYDRGYLAKLRHPLRTRIYNNLVTDLENLTLMNQELNKELGRDVVLGDFSGKTLKTVNGKKGKIYDITCAYFSFKYCPSCSKLADFSRVLKINSSDWRAEYGIYIPSKVSSKKLQKVSSKKISSNKELERSPSPSPRPTSSGGKYRRRHTVKKYKK
jgi:hypothetical protein